MNRIAILSAIAGAGWLVYLLAPVLTPFALAALLAYLTDPLADRLEAAGLQRPTAVVLVFAVMLLAIAVILGLVIPVLEDQIGNFIDNLPAYTRWMKNSALPWLQKHLGLRIRFVDPDQIAGMLNAHWQQAGGTAAAILGSLSHSGMVMASWLMNLFLIPVVLFYLLRDWDALVQRMHDLLPRAWAPTATRLAREADEVLGSVFRGQITVMAALGVMYSLGLWAVGLNFALLIGMLAGLVSFIPYAGTITGIGVASVVALAQFGEFGPVLLVWVVFGIGQLLEGMWLTPTLVGNRIGLHPIAVIFAVLAGGQLFGFLGVLLALPLASVVMVLLRHIHEIYKDSELYGAASPREPAPPSALPGEPD